MLRRLNRNKQSKVQPRRKMHFEPLEPRILLSADLGIESLVLQADHLLAAAPIAGELLPQESLTVQSGENPSEFNSQTAAVQNELIIVDSAVDDYQSLIEQISAAGNTNRQIEVLAAGQDGFEQISSILAGQKDLSAVHLISHGAEGQLFLGSSSVNIQSVQANADLLQLWGEALTDDADLLLYGCNVAAGDAGLTFIDSLAELTAADVAASSDTTGSEIQHGDWELEVQRGEIQTSSLVAGNYQHLLVAELETTGVRTALNAGLDAFETQLIDIVASDALLDKPLPLLIESVTSGDSTTSSALAMNDLFVLDATNDFQKIFHDLVIENLSTALNEADFDAFQTYLQNLNDTSITGATVQFNSVSDLSADAALLYRVQFTLNVNSEQTFDLGTVADELGIAFPAEQRIDTSANLSMTLDIGVHSSGEDVVEEDFYLDLSAATVTVSAAKNDFSAADINIGFVGASVTNGTAALSASIDLDLQTDSSSPAALGFFSTSISADTGQIVADNPPDSLVLSEDLSFMLRIGHGDSREVVVTALATDGNNDLDDLILDLQTAINDAGFSGQIIVSENTGRLVMTVVADNSPLGFSDQNIISSNGLLTADQLSNVLGSTEGAVVNFFLAVEDAAPLFITVTVTADAANPVTIDSLVINVNDALAAAGITTILASKTADDRLQLENDNPLNTFLMTRQLNLWSGISRSDLDSLQSAELFVTTEGLSSSSVALNITVAAGLTEAGQTGDWNPGVQTVTTASNNLFALGAPQTDAYGNTRFGLEVALSPDLMSFSYLTASDVVNQLRSFASWLDRLRVSEIYSDQIPFADATFGDIFDYQGMFEDLLLDDNNSDGVDDKLVGEDNNPVFANAQDFATALTSLIPAANLRYDALNRQLLFDLDLSQAFNPLDVPVDFNTDLFDLNALQNVRSDSLVQLTGGTALTLTLGIDLQESAQLQGSTTLAELNYGNGVTIKTVEAVTTETVRKLYGRVSADATFSINVAGQDRLVTLLQSVTENNETVEHLAADLDTVIKAATDGLVGARVNADNAQRIDIYSLDGATTFTLTVADSSDPAIRELGLEAQMGGAGGAIAVTTVKSAPLVVGLLDGAVSFTVAIDGQTTEVTIEAVKTETNNNILDLVNDVNAALQNSALPENMLSVSSQGNRLVFSAVADNTSFTITPGANADQIGIANQLDSTTADFVIHFSDGTSTDVSLDSLTANSSIDELLLLLNAVNNLSAQIGADGTHLELVDETFAPANTDSFAIEALNGSKAIIQLGLLRSDLKNSTDEADGQIEGGTIFGTRLQDRFFVVDGTLGGSFLLDATVAASADYGFVGVGLAGGGQVAGNLTSNFLQPGSGALTFSHLYANLGTITDVVDGPVSQFVPGQDHLTFSVDVNPDVAYITEPTGSIVLTATSLTGGTINLTDLAASEELAQFKELTANDIVNALDQLAVFLADFETSGNLADPLALINQSVHDLLGLATKFDLAVEAFRDNPATNIQSLNTRLQEAFGLAANAVILSLDGDKLKISLQIEQTINDSINLDISLGDEQTRLAGPAGLKAEGVLNLNLDFAVDLANPSDVYLYETTEISGHLLVTGAGLNFWTSLEPYAGANLSVYVQDGSATLDLVDFGATLDFGAPVLIANVDFSTIDTVALGTVAANLPGYAPTQSEFAGDISLNGGIFQIDLTDPTLLSLLGADEILAAVDPAEQSPYNNLLMAVEGLDLFFAGLQDLLDGEVFGINLPLIGDQFAEGARFIENLRDDFIDPFRIQVEETIDPNADLLSNLLYLLLGNQLDLLLTVDDSGNVVKADSATDIELEIGEDDDFIQWNLKIGTPSQRLVGTDIDLDLGIPGLGIDIDGDVGIDLGWNLDLKFGISNEDGFYLDISDPSDLKIDLDVELPTNITGQLGFLQLHAIDHFVDLDGDGLDDELNSGLGASFAVDLISRMALKADSGEPFQLTKITAINAQGDTELGFSLTPAGQKVIVADNDAPLDGRLDNNVGIDLLIDGVTKSISVLSSATTDNHSIDDLVADLNQALKQAGLEDTIKAGRDGDRLTLKSLPVIKSFRVENSGSQELFGAALDSAGKSYLLLNKNTPENGVLEDDILFKVIVTAGQNVGREYTISLDAADTKDNESFTELVAQLNEALEIAGLAEMSFSSGDPRLSLGELSTLGVNFGLAAEAIADLDLTLAISEDLIGEDTGVLPDIYSNFVLEWGFGDRTEGEDQEYISFSADELKDAVANGLQLVTFNDVSLDLGSFISDFVEPILGEIRSITEPVQPVVDILTMEIPVISDLSGSPVTLLDIADLFGTVNADFIRGVANVINLINDIPLGAESILINFGDLPIYVQGDDLDLTDKNADLGSVDKPAGNSFDDTPNANDSSTQSFAKNINKSEGFAFPILSDPQQVFSLLLGQEATLMSYDLPDLFLDFSYSQYFPIFGPLGASITGSFSADIDFHEIGFDTFGIMQFADSGFRNPELIFEGFFISDLDDSGSDVPEVTLTGGLSAAAELNLGVARGGAAGGIFASIYFDLFDPNQDGKVRINEILTTIDSQARFGNAALAPLSVFDVSGEVYARLFAFLDIDLFLFSFYDEWNITPPITLVDFEIPFARPPQLATELADGVLQLNMGEFAEQRLYGNISDGDENFSVSGTANSLTVSAFGYSQTYTGNFSKIVAAAGEGNDIVNLSGVAATVTAEIDGGAGSDTLTAGSGMALIRGGDGNDHIYGGTGSDLLFGDAGNDIIDGGNGNDIIIGDAARIGDDYIRVRASLIDGDDILSGAGGEDIIIGGGGADTISGGDEKDVIIGDSGRISFVSTSLSVANIAEISDTDRGLVFAADLLSGDDGDDEIYGGKGDDTLSGGLGNDTLYGEVGDDTILAASGSDTVYAGAGNDLVLADRDQLAAAGGIPGGATIYGEEGDDIIIGSSAVDTIVGGRGQDIVFAGGGADIIIGGQGNDLLNGEEGGDDYRLTLTGGIISSTASIYDTGAVADNDILTINGSDEADRFLLRASYVADQSLLGLEAHLASLTVLPADLFLTLALPATLPSRAFVAKLNGDDHAERANYYYIENVIVNGLGGDDQFAVDDTSAVVQINGGEDNDLFQIGQLYNSPRDAEAGVDEFDLFTTVQTTRGFLSNGVSESMIINGQSGSDKFVVFRNLAVLTLKGGTDNDEFVVKAFALEGSVDDPDRDRTEISGQEGADRIEYAINAPVDIDGGDGFDTVKVIGTEFGDDFVVTEDGIYGAGLNINFINVEKVTLDAAEGNDRIYIRSTGEGQITEIFAGEGSDTFSIGGDSPPIVSRDLLGHSGVVSHSSSSEDSRFDGLIIDGISANVADNEEAGIVVSALDLVRSWEAGAFGQYAIVLSKRPENDVTISLIQQQPTPNETAAGIEYYQLVDEFGNNLSSITFTAANWDQQQNVYIQALDDTVAEGFHYAVINHKVVSDDTGYDGLAIPTVTVELVDNDTLDILITETGGATQVIEGGSFTDSFPLVDSYLVGLTAVPQNGETVIVRLTDPTGQLTFDQTELVLSLANGYVQEVFVTAVADGLREGIHTSYIHHSLQVGTQAAVDGPQLRVDIGDSDVPGVMVVQSDGSTNVIENDLNKTSAPFTDSYQIVLTARPDTDVTVAVDPQVTKTSAQIFDPATGKYVTVDRFAEQVVVDQTTLIFTSANWWQPQTVTVTALDDAVIDGGDTKVFAPVANTIAGIQGPLFIDGGGGEGSGAGLGGNPFMLPLENNDVGDVVDATADTLVVAREDVDKLGETYFNDLSLVKVIIASGTGAGQERYLLERTIGAAQENYLFEIAQAWETVPDATSRYYFERELPQVDESQQVDIATVYNQDSPADNLGDRQGILSADNLSGLGMGPDLQIGGSTFAGGVSYQNLENLTINLGSGNDQLEVTGIQNREDFQTVTVVNTGAGDDWVHFNGPQAAKSGLFALHLEQGDDRVTAENTTASLVIFGDDGTDDIQSGAGNDIIFADFGRVDYRNDSGELITRFGLGQRGVIRDAVIATDDFASVPFAQTDGGFYGPSIAESRLFTTGWNDVVRGGAGNDLLIGGFGDDQMHGDAGNDILIGDNGSATFLNGQLTEVESGDPNQGGIDELHGGSGSDLLIGGAKADQLYGDAGNDYLVGDAGRATYFAGSLRMVETIDEHRFIGGDDWLNGGTGFDAMFGGHGDDTFVGDFAEDLMIGEYARLTVVDGKAESVVRLAQGELDLIASRQFGLYNPLALAPSLTQLGSVMQPAQLQALISGQRPGSVLTAKNTHHGEDFSVAAKDLGYGYHPEEHDVEDPAEQPVSPELLDEPLPLPAETPADKAEILPENEPGEQQDDIPVELKEDGLPEVPENLLDKIENPLQAAVIGFAGWGLVSSQRSKARATGLLDLDKIKKSEQSWRWQDGRLSKSGWAGEESATSGRRLNADLPRIKTEIKLKKRA